MKIHILSDLHVEFSPPSLPSTDADVVVLAGDIGVHLQGLGFAESTFPGRPVIYVAGNHEYYGQAIPQLTEELREKTTGSHVRFLDEAEAVIGGVRFLGCTLWTDFTLFGRDRQMQAMETARVYMSDYKRIRRSPRNAKLSPVDTLAFHQRARTWLEEALARPFEGPTVVVTHHAPTPRSNPEAYRDDLISAAYVNDLGPLMSASRVKLWIHGHTHHCVDYQENGTRVVSNQRGYPDTPVPGYQPGFVVEV
jgi:predicted phosphodiesterase